MKKVLAMVAALVAAAALAVVAAPPAQAAGWTEQRCTNPVQTGKVCVQVHTVASGNGVRVDATQVCFTQIPGNFGYVPRGTKSNAIFFYGANGQYLGGFAMNNTGGSTQGYGTCTMTGPFAGVQMGKQACFVAGGTVDMPFGGDASWSKNGAVLGGNWTCG